MKRICRTNGWGVFGLLMTAGFSFALPLKANTDASVEQHFRNGRVYVTVKAPAAGGIGWQSYFKYLPPKGFNLLFTDTCPDAAPTPVNGSFNPSASTQVGLTLVAYNFPKGTASWSWTIDWPAGAPANSVIYFNVYCVK